MAQNMNAEQARNMLNTIRAQASDRYREVVPVATADNISLIGNPILSGDYQFAYNECMEKLFNKIVWTILWTRVYNNKFALLKKGVNPLGGDIEEIHTNPLDEMDDDACCASTLLDDVCENDVEVEYHRRNRVKKFCECINRKKLRTAFTSYAALASFINNLISQLASSNEIWEERYTKALMSEAYEENKVIKKQVTYPTDFESAKAFAKQIRLDSKNMRWESSAYNAWAQYTGRPPRVTWTPDDQRVLLIRNDVSTELDYELLAWAFNLDVARVPEMVIEVNNFGTNDNILAVLCDQAWFQIYDDDKEVNDFFDPSNRAWKYYYHVEQTYSISLFANCVFYTTENITPGVTGITVTPETSDVVIGSSQQFTAIVTGTGDYDNTVTWSLSPTIAGAEITANGLLTLTSAVTAGQTITVTATANGDNTKSASAIVTTRVPDVRALAEEAESSGSDEVESAEKPKATRKTATKK